MNLTNKKLIIGILAFLIIVNLLVIFNIDFYYIRAILAFIFIITIPGLLIMLALKIRNISFWEYLVYTLGLSIAFIMFAGLHANWTLPAFGITDKPLSTIPILIEFDIFLVILSFFAYMRNKDLNFKIQFPKFSWLDRIFIVIPFCFPFMAVIGAFLLNNHGTNIVTIVMLGMIALYVLLVVIFRNKLNENVFPWALWMISIALIFSFWLRSNYILGVDVNVEYWVSNLSIEKSAWKITNYRNSYNAMLSLTILPAIIKFFSDLSLQYVYKLNFSLIYSTIPLIMFLFFKKYKVDNYLCFLGSFFFLSSFYFFATPGRQIIAFLFFSLILLAIAYEGKQIIKKTFLIIFGFSMIVSHYSTSYIVLVILILMYIFSSVYKRYKHNNPKINKINKREKAELDLSLGTVLLLLIFLFLWYSQLTGISSGPVDFIKRSISNLPNIFNEEVQVEGNSIFDNIFVFQKKVNTIDTLEKYKEDTANRYLINDSNEDFKQSNKGQYSTYLKYPSDFPKVTNDEINKIPSYNQKYLEFIFRIFIFIGVICLIFFNKKKVKIEFILLNFIAFFILILFAILPFFSYYYDLPRFYLNLLIILSLPAIIGLETISLLIFRKKFIFIIILIVLVEIYFLSNSGFFYGIAGGSGTPLRLSNNGWEADLNYVYDSEIDSASWLVNNKDKNPTHLDNYANLRAIIAGIIGRGEKNMPDVLPQIIKKKSYVYASYTNTQRGVSIKAFDRVVLSLNFPTFFLNENKNLIYNNGGSEIFR